MRYYSTLLLSSSLLVANEFASTLSSQGFTGLINTPNAQVIKEGDTTFSINNQFDNNLRAYDYNVPKSSQEDFILGVGFLSGMEFVGRLTEVEAFTEARRQRFDFEHRDLSVNSKFQLPYTHNYLPNIAFGLQDFGGAGNIYTNYYAVMDKEFGFLRTSLGYGKSGNNKTSKRMDGVFGGVEVKITDWLHLLAEHDGQEEHAAIRLQVPKEWIGGYNVGATVAQNISDAQTSVALNLSIPLFHSTSHTQPLSLKKENIVTHSITTDTDFEHNIKKPVSKVEKKNKMLTLQQSLVEIGFENVQVGEYRDSIYVKCENNIFDHTELDALGVILGSISEIDKKDTHFIVTLLKNNLQTLTVSGNSKVFNNYVVEPNSENKIALQNNLKFSRTFDEKNVKFVSSKQNSSFFKPRLELSPGLTTTVGTEVGLFDYLVALRANVYTTLYDGLTVSAMYEIPFLQSENFNDGNVYSTIYKDRLENRLVNANLHQTLQYESFLNTTSIGQFRTDYQGVLNHTNYTSTSGSHGLNLRVGTFEEKSNSNVEKKNVYIGSYRYFYAPLDLFGEVAYGQYWDQDKGAMLELKRFFGETAISLYYKDTQKSYVGFNVSLPLTTRKSYDTKLAQIKGKKDFNYGIRTVVRSDENLISPSGAIVPTTDLELTTHYLDRDRLNAGYVKQHLDRVREAYFKYE